MGSENGKLLGGSRCLGGCRRDYDVPQLPDNPTVAQMKNHKERKNRKAKANACLFVGVSKTIFIRIMKLKNASAIWNYLKEYEEDDRI